MTPRMIRYHPNTLKSCFLIYPIKNLITTSDTANATTIPTTRITTSWEVIVAFIKNFAPFKRLAPNITGIARKNVYSAATVLEIPSNNAPTIVAPERDVPGKNRCDQLKHSYPECQFIINSDKGINLCLFSFVIILNHNKCYTKQDQHNCYCLVIVK